MMSITYDPSCRNDVLNDLSQLRINGESVHKLESLGAIYIHHTKRVNVFRRFNSVYEILFETDDHTIHFHKNVRIMDSLHQLLGSEMDALEVMEVYSYKHHGALITPEAFHLPTLHWSELHYTWGGVSLYLESARREMSPLVCHEVYQESESEPESESEQEPEPLVQTPSSRRCLSDRFTALLQKRAFSESDSEPDEEDCCTVLRSGMKYPRHFH